jgi:hypothetical protein
MGKSIMKNILVILVALIGFSINAHAQYVYYIGSHKFVGGGINTTNAYSGRNVSSDGYNYKNRPETTNIKDIGAIPAGTYYITEVTSSKGAMTIVLSEDPVNDMHGRSLFRIHGDKSSNNASIGCIILPRDDRQKIVNAYNAWVNGGKKGAILTLNVYE